MRIKHKQREYELMQVVEEYFDSALVLMALVNADGSRGKVVRTVIDW